MYLNAKKMAFLGLLLAWTTILIVLSGIIEFNTLFLLAAASFAVGIAIRETGIGLGFGFFLGSIILGLFLAPNKLYCITYSALAFYILLVEFVWEKLTNAPGGHKRKWYFWILKYVIFNCLYIPIIIFLPKLVYQGTVNVSILAALIIGGQAALFLYDKAYEYFQQAIWGKLRNRLRL